MVNSIILLIFRNYRIPSVDSRPPPHPGDPPCPPWVSISDSTGLRWSKQNFVNMIIKKMIK